MKIYIRAMADSPKEIATHLKNISWEIDEHIIKLLILPNCREANHWKREVARFLSRIDKLKSKNKWPKASFIRDNLAVHNDMIDELVYQVWNNLSEDNKRYLKIGTIKQCIEVYQSWIATELSKNGAIEYVKIYDKLDEIVESTYE